MEYVLFVIKFTMVQIIGKVKKLIRNVLMKILNLMHDQQCVVNTINVRVWNMRQSYQMERILKVKKRKERNRWSVIVRQI